MPHYSLKDVKRLIRDGDIQIQPNALQSAYNDFGWEPENIKKCLLKLNGKLHTADRKNNHFYKTDPHKRFPNTEMDYYKAMNIMQGFNIYTHFYIHPNSGKLVISSFKELKQ